MLERERESESESGGAPAIDVVTQEEVVVEGGLAPDLEQLQQIEELPVHCKHHLASAIPGTFTNKKWHIEQ